MNNSELYPYIQDYFGSHLDKETKKMQQEYQLMENSIRKLTVYNKIVLEIYGSLYLIGIGAAIGGCRCNNTTFLVMVVAFFGMTNLIASYSSRIQESIHQLENRQIRIYTKIRRREKDKSKL